MLMQGQYFSPTDSVKVLPEYFLIHANGLAPKTDAPHWSQLKPYQFEFQHSLSHQCVQLLAERGFF